MEWFSLEKQLVNFMKKILTLLLLTGLYCKAQFLGFEVKNTLNQRLGHGLSYITGSISLDSIGVLESEIIKNPNDDTIRILYTGMRLGNSTAVFLSTTDSIGGTLTKRGAVIGQGASGVSRFANCTGAVFYQDTLYAWCAVGYGGDVYLYKSTNKGYSFDAGTIAFQRGVTIPLTQGFGNSGILKDTSGQPKIINGKFRMYAEANEGFHWMTYLCESTSLRGPWTLIQNVSTLRVNGGSYSGGAPIWLDSVYHMFFHYSPNGTSVIPTYVGYATSTDGINFTQKEVAYKKLESYPFGSSNPNDLQIADMTIAQIKGRVYHIAEFYRNNVDPAKSSIYRWQYNGTFKDLITNLTICIGCVGVYP
jgi:hypothetical protein